MNWWLIIYLALTVLGSAITMVKCDTAPERVGAFIGFIVTVWLLYMAGVFTLL